jgi:hypothetical protein
MVSGCRNFLLGVRNDASVREAGSPTGWTFLLLGTEGIRP